MARPRSFATGSAMDVGHVRVALRMAARQAEMFGRAGDRQAKFGEGGGVLLVRHLHVGLFEVAPLGELGAEEVARQCCGMGSIWVGRSRLEPAIVRADLAQKITSSVS